MVRTPISDDGGDFELTIVRVFAAPIEVVFAACSEPDQLARWLGPAGFTARDLTGELRVGGAWRSCIRNDADATEYWSHGVYHEITPPTRLVHTFAWDEADGTPERETLIAYTFVARGGCTETTFTQRPFESAQRRDSHAHGWAQSFDDLAAYLATVTPVRKPIAM